jgi:hypothetical protein
MFAGSWRQALLCAVCWLRMGAAFRGEVSFVLGMGGILSYHGEAAAETAEIRGACAPLDAG